MLVRTRSLALQLLSVKYGLYACSRDGRVVSRETQELFARSLVISCESYEVAEPYSEPESEVSRLLFVAPITPKSLAASPLMLPVPAKAFVKAGLLSLDRRSLLSINFSFHSVQLHGEYDTTIVLPKRLRESAYSGNDVDRETVHKIEELLAVPRRAPFESLKRSFIATSKHSSSTFIGGFGASSRSPQNDKQLYRALRIADPTEVTNESHAMKIRWELRTME